MHTELWNHWWLHAGGTAGQLGKTFCDRCARGGPALRVSPYLSPWGGIEGDGRRVVVPFFWVNYWRGDEGRSVYLNLNPSADLRFSPNLTVQIYAEPFISKGKYSDVREIADARARAYVDRFSPYGGSFAADTEFNFKQFRSNTVLRWEYKPGSTIFLVWTQGRGDYDPRRGTRSFGGDFRDLFREHPDNTFLIKVSHWFDW